MLSPGAKIDDRYEIISALGAGGMGAVYRARRLHLGDEVAIKVMQAKPDAPPESRDRFLRESRACAQLRHPNIVGLLDFGFDDANQPFMVMELLSGPSLLEEIKLEAPMAPARVADILESVASALQLAHDRGITHRDLKPANIVAHKYDSGERVYKVIDFGLAAMTMKSDETRLTDPAFFLGTLAYAAPEQMTGQEITSATDVYALGVIAYEMLTGGLPFDASNQATLVTQLLTVDPARATTRRGSLPQAVDDAVMKALAKKRMAQAKVQPLLAQYEEELDRELVNREKVQDDLMTRMGEMRFGPDMDQGKMQKMIEEGRDAAKRVREVNRKYARQVQDQLPEDQQFAFAKAFKTASYPDVYRETYTNTAIGSALGFADLDANQKQSVQAIRDSYGRDVAVLNDKIAVAQEEMEENFNLERMRDGGDRTQDGLRELRRQKRELDETTVESLRKVLTPEQQDRLPQREQRGQGGQGGGRGGEDGGQRRRGGDGQGGGRGDRM